MTWLVPYFKVKQGGSGEQLIGLQKDKVKLKQEKKKKETTKVYQQSKADKHESGVGEGGW